MQQLSLPQLNFSRFIAAVSVVLFHFARKTPPFDQGFLFDLFSEAGLAVGYFFLLSGFIMAVVYLPRFEGGKFSGKNYWVARVARILPLYLFAFVLSLILTMWLRDQYPRGLSIILQALGLHAWVPGYTLSINFPGWSISVEWLFYLLFPLLLPWMAKMKSWKMWLLTIGIWAVSATWHVLSYKVLQGFDPQKTGDFILRWPPFHLNAFMVGLAGGIWFMRGGKDGAWTKGPIPLIGAMVSFGLIVAMLTVPNPILPYATNGIPAFLYLAFILFMSVDRSPVSRFFSAKPFVYLGEISYGIYLLQAPVEVAMKPILANMNIDIEGTNGFFIYLAVLLLFSSLIFHALENPARTWIRGKWGKVRAS